MYNYYTKKILIFIDRHQEDIYFSLMHTFVAL